MSASLRPAPGTHRPGGAFPAAVAARDRRRRSRCRRHPGGEGLGRLPGADGESGGLAQRAPYRQGRVRRRPGRHRQGPSGLPQFALLGICPEDRCRRVRPGRKTVTVRATARSGLVADAMAPVEVPTPRLAQGRRVGDGLRTIGRRAGPDHRGTSLRQGLAGAAAPAETVAALFDGEEIGLAEIGIERPDIGSLFPALRHARQSGFEFQTRLGGPIVGKHQVTLLLCLEGGRVEEIELAVAAVDARDITLGVYGRRPRPPAASRCPRGDRRRPGGAGGRQSRRSPGWGLARAGVAAVEIAIDGQPTAIADHGLRRLDIRAAFPRLGRFARQRLHRAVAAPHLPWAAHTVSVSLRDKGGGTPGTEFRIVVEELPEAAGPWSLRRRMPQGEADLSRRLVERSGRETLFIAVLPVGGDRAALAGARVTIASLCTQAYPNWRLLVVPQGSGGRSGAALLAAIGPLSERGEVVRSVTAEILTGIAAAAGKPAAMPSDRARAGRRAGLRRLPRDGRRDGHRCRRRFPLQRRTCDESGLG